MATLERAIRVLPAGSAAAEDGSVKDRVRAVLAGPPACSQRQVADEADISTSALSQYLKDKYPGNVAEVEAKLERWLAGRGQTEGMRAVVPDPPAFYATATAAEVMDAFRYAQSMEDMVCVMGIPGVGKTTACTEYQRTRSNVWVVELAAHTFGVVPVLRLIAEAVGGGNGSGASGLAREIAGKVRGKKGLLIVDEAHHADPKTLDAIRALHDSTHIGVALVGGVELAAKLDRLPQLSSRLGLRLSRKRVVSGDVHALLDAWQISGRDERKFLTAVAGRAGALRSVTKVLRLASLRARTEGAALSLDHLQTAAATLTTRNTVEG